MSSRFVRAFAPASGTGGTLSCAANINRAPAPLLAAAWQAERLIEARQVLARLQRHPVTLVILACRVLRQHGTSAERADAAALLGLTDHADRICRTRHARQKRGGAA